MPWTTNLSREELLQRLTDLAFQKLVDGQWDASWDVDHDIAALLDEVASSIESKSVISGDVGTTKMPAKCPSCGGRMALNGSPWTKWEGFMECQRCGISLGKP